MPRNLIRRLARTLNWRCIECDTWNADTDTVCMCCAS